MSTVLDQIIAEMLQSTETLSPLDGVLPAPEAPAPTPRAPEEARSFAEASDPELAISALRVREVEQ